MNQLAKKAIILMSAAVLFGSGSFALGATGAMSAINQAMLESRCDSGAFIHHSSTAGAVEADSQPTDSVTLQSSPATAGAAATSLKVLSSNLIHNSGLEDGNGTDPTGWQHNVYGQNQASFSLVAGENSNSAVRTTTSSYTNGDADWYYSPASVQPGGYYRYTDDYRSNASTRAILALYDDAGQIQYIDLSATGPAADWTHYQATFFIPSNIKRAMVFHPLAAKGFLDIDNLSLEQVQPVGFASPLVSLTFDDGWRSIHDNALPLLKKFKFPSTQYIISGYVGQDKNYMTPSDVYQFQKSGSEIASHTVDHPDLTKETPDKLTYELKNSQADLSKCFGPQVDFAEPYGTFNATTTTQVQKYYETARSTDAGFNTADNFNPYALLVQNVTANTSETEINSWLATAKQNHAWLILVYHQVDNTGSQFSRRPANLKADLDSVKASGIEVKTMHQAYAQLTSKTEAKK